ncbi:MAG TPA: zinc-binding alcohol dehydrogenase [Planctomycetota bacterium]|nr:zinc-binding alcohol dehydrogenase [Planctomycetota bacterium]
MSTATASAPALNAVATMTAKSVRFMGERVELIDEEVTALKPNQVRLRTETTLVSIGTEIAWIEQKAKTKEPCWLGYSYVGTIEALGSDVSGHRVGERVLASKGHCSGGNLSVEPGSLVPVPEGLSSERAAFGTLAAIAYHIVQRAAPRLNEPTVVIGQGAVGSLILQVAKMAGASPLIAVDMDPARLEMAAKLGAIPLNPAKDDVVARVKELTGGDGVPLCIEVATNPKAFELAFKLLGLRGRLIVTSTLFESVPMPILDGFIEKEISVIGAHAPKTPATPNTYYPYTQAGNKAAAMQAMLDGRLKVDHLLSHKIKPHEAPAIYERLRQKDRSIVGVLIDWR